MTEKNADAEVLEVINVNAYYNARKVLDSIKFNAKKGEFIGIIGPNGSGKTTLLRVIARILKPKSGKVLLYSRDILDYSQRDLAKICASVPQDTNISFDFTALDIVLMGRNPHLKSRFSLESPQDVEIAEECMRMTKCLSLASRRINELSGGERQRVIIARALAQKPKILLLDEPTAHLDINYQIEIMEILRELASKGIVVIAAIHDLNLALQFCDRIILINKGKIAAIGTPEEVITADKVREVFGVDVIVRKNDATGRIFILPALTHAFPERHAERTERCADKASAAVGTVGKAEQETASVSEGDSSEGEVRGKSEKNRRMNRKGNRESASMRIHLICGGGRGASLMRALVSSGYDVSAGVLNVLDADFEAASALGIPVVAEAPFSPISDEAHRDNLRMIDEADVLVLCDIPFGIGNLKNLEAVLYAKNCGKPLIMYEMKIEDRDFTGGKASEILREITKYAIIVRNEEEVLSLLQSISLSSSISSIEPASYPVNFSASTSSSSPSERERM